MDHTQLPWRLRTFRIAGVDLQYSPDPVDGAGRKWFSVIESADGHRVMETFGATAEEAEANARLVLQRVNAYDALFAAVTRAYQVEHSVTQGEERELRQGYHRLLDEAIRVAGVGIGTHV